MTSFGLATAFAPSHQISSIWLFELKMLLTLGALLGLAAALFRYYSQQRARVDPQENVLST